MDETRSRLGLRALLALLVVVVTVAAFWVTSAFAADGSAVNDRSSSDSPAAVYAQNEDDGAAPNRDCPNRDDESEQSSDA